MSPVENEAPFSINKEGFKTGKISDMNGMDIELTECLEHARNTALSYFQPIIENVKIVF